MFVLASPLFISNNIKCATNYCKTGKVPSLKQFLSAKLRSLCGDQMKSSATFLLTTVGGGNGVEVDGQAVVEFAGHFCCHGGLDRVVAVSVFLLHTLHKLYEQLLDVCGQNNVW